MTGSAWLMLGLTWTVVIFFALRFFLKVATLPAQADPAVPGDAPDSDSDPGTVSGERE